MGCKVSAQAFRHFWDQDQGPSRAKCCQKLHALSLTLSAVTAGNLPATTAPPAGSGAAAAAFLRSPEGQRALSRGCDDEPFAQARIDSARLATLRTPATTSGQLDLGDGTSTCSMDLAMPPVERDDKLRLPPGTALLCARSDLAGPHLRAHLLPCATAIDSDESEADADLFQWSQELPVDDAAFTAALGV